MMKLKSFIPQKAKNYLKHLPLALLALLYYRFPSRKLRVIGVTGTDGKTTTASLIYHLLNKAGHSAALISTVGAKVGKKEIDTGLHVTAPNPWFLQKIIRQIVEQGIDYLVLEVTSHGLDQFRLLGIDFEVGVLTNITHEHLDYHSSFDDYRRAKLKLFLRAKTAVLNRDDASFGFVKANLSRQKILSYGIDSSADITPRKLVFKTPLLGKHNLYNCLASLATISALGLSLDKAKKEIASFTGVEGRLEKVDEGQNFAVFVDFAHTPNALEQTLKTLKKQLGKGHRLIAVFGSAGERDKGKRPLMGKAASQYADLIVLTADDPRYEKVSDICAQIQKGFLQRDYRVKVIEDRQKAIKYALSQAARGDIVALCGKGHEKSLAMAGKEIPWSDKKTAQKLIKKLFKKEAKK